MKASCIPADESRQLLKALAEVDWSKPANRDMIAPFQGFVFLGLTEKDGWVPPKVQPGENYTKVTQAAYVKWLDGPGKDYQIKQVVAKAK